MAEIFLRAVAMATNFGTKTKTGFVWMIATRQLLMEGGLSGQPTECRYCRYRAPKGLAFYIRGADVEYDWTIHVWQAAAMRPYVELLWPLVLLVWRHVNCISANIRDWEEVCVDLSYRKISILLPDLSITALKICYTYPCTWLKKFLCLILGESLSST